MSGTSSTRSDPRSAVRTFVTFRVAGDDLAPDQITKFLKLIPTQAYAKGEFYTAGPRSAELRGRTGVWYFSTDRLVASDRLQDHLDFLLLNLLGASHAHGQVAAQWATSLTQLKHLLERKSLRAVVTCFWDGPAGMKAPTIPRNVTNLFKLISVDIETDFNTEEEPPALAPNLAQA